MLRSYRPYRHYPAIVIALALIAVCQNAHADQGQHAAANAETEPLEAASLDDINRSGSHVDTESDGDSEVVKWAKIRLKQLELQPDNGDANPLTNQENLDFRSVMNSDSESLLSPEALRDLFYADAARAEVRLWRLR